MIDAKLQTKVLKIVGSTVLATADKLLLRKKFYLLMNEQIDLEMNQNIFDKKVKEYEQEINRISQLIDKSVSNEVAKEVEQLKQLAPKITQDLYTEDVAPVHAATPPIGVRVRMQEELQNDDESGTVEEIPIDLDQE